MINLNLNLTKGGWTRTIRQCIYVDGAGKMADVEVVISYLESLISDDFELSMPNGEIQYTIEDFYKALEFALISEGSLSNNKVYEYGNILTILLPFRHNKTETPGEIPEISVCQRA